jgi:hypothetical protein
MTFFCIPVFVGAAPLLTEVLLVTLRVASFDGGPWNVIAASHAFRFGLSAGIVFIWLALPTPFVEFPKILVTTFMPF